MITNEDIEQIYRNLSARNLEQEIIKKDGYTHIQISTLAFLFFIITYSMLLCYFLMDVLKNV